MIRQVESSYLLENASLQGIVAGEEQSRLLSDFIMQFNVKSFDEIMRHKNEYDQKSRIISIGMSWNLIISGIGR